MPEQRTNGHSISRLTAHIAWSTKYRYNALQGDIQIRCRTILVQICESEDVLILKGVVFKDHIHIEYRPSLSLSNLIKKLKDRSSRKLQVEYPELKQRYWGRHFWGIGLWVLKYRKYHRCHG